MSGFYQPKSTQGVYDAATNRLTVNCGDDVLIGFRSTPPKSLDDIDLDADDISMIVGRYAAGNNAIEMKIDTSHPARFNLTATETPNMSAPRDVVKPLEIVVRYRNFESYSPCGQWKDASACWAASLSWWLGVTDRVPLTYNHFMMMFHNVWLRDGTISIFGLQQGLRAHNNQFHIRTESISPGSLSSYFGRWPLVVGFKAPGGYGHMNVLYGSQGGNVSAMEPWSPDPGDDGVDEQNGIMYLTNPDFEFRGAYVNRPLSYYQTPVSSGQLFVGYPEEYLKRLPG